MKHFEVNGSIAGADKLPDGMRSWRKNVSAHVIALSARRACELVEAKYPGVEIHSVNHRGLIDVIEDAEGPDA